jgi:hypothetical protein
MRRKARPIIYVCTAIKEDLLVSKMIESQTIEDSYLIFEKENGIKPQVVLGPFYKKRTGTLDKHFDIKFKPGQTKRGIHNGWQVTAMPLSNPPDSAYLFYDRKVDGQKGIKPVSTIIKLKDLQEIK